MKWIEEDDLLHMFEERDECLKENEDEEDLSACYFDVPIQYRPTQVGVKNESIRTN